MAWNLFLILVCVKYCAGSQEDVDYLAGNIDIVWEVVDNFPGDGFEGRINMTNTGEREFTSMDWRIYIPNIRLFKNIKPNGTQFGNGLGLWISHVNGDVNRVHPTDEFEGFPRGFTLSADFTASDWMVAKSDIMPNWYVTSNSSEPRVIESTMGERLNVVAPFLSERQWKRSTNDKYDPYTPEARLALSGAANLGDVSLPVVPQPVEVRRHIVDVVIIDQGWVVIDSKPSLQFESQYLAEKLHIQVIDPGDAPIRRYISINIDFVVNSTGDVLDVPGAYSVRCYTGTDTIEVVGIDAAGVFYGVQTLMSLVKDDGTQKTVEDISVIDFPRFPYRGMHMDVARNFHGKSDVLRHLEAMATYKLNKFHFHLTDDEGWRLEIPGLPELSEVGSKRCHDESGDRCITPQLGAGPSLPNAGSGHLSTAEYREVLRYARDRHITVIPEFDMPGHGHAAVNAMLARYRKYRDANLTRAEEYLLTDLNDTSEYLSVQHYTDNAINPCVESTYRFVEHVIGAAVELHRDIQPLTTFNFGGDEVPGGAWLGSPACQKLMSREGYTTSAALKEHFVVRVAELSHAQGLDLSGWEDGLMDVNRPYNRTALPNPNVYVYLWDNVWEWGRGERAYVMANAGYKVILSHSTHLYFDFPYEPDPEDRGYYWATRCTGTKKAFGFSPDNIYDNMDILDGMGSPLDRERICRDFGCVPLADGKRDNVIGMQGHIWTETVRTSEQLDYMVFPRMLSVAERAWHVASWERLEVGEERDSLRQEDWEKFANTLGYKELARLGQMNISYGIPPTGARLNGDTLEAESNYPGLPIQMSWNDGRTWTAYKSQTTVPPGETVHLRTQSADQVRHSRPVLLTNPSNHASLTTGSVCLSLITTIIACRIVRIR